jgi:excisionase family DNA binding protein
LMMAREKGHTDVIRLLKEAEASSSNGIDRKDGVPDDGYSYLYLLKEELEEKLYSKPSDDAVSQLLHALQTQIDAARKERLLNPSELSHKLTLTIQEAALLSGLPRQHLLDALEEGRLKAQQLKHVWRITRSDLDEYIRLLS